MNSPLATITKYPTSVTQSSGTNQIQFNNLANLKNSNNTYAKSKDRLHKNNIPSAITATGFNFNLPVGSEITNIKVEYAHQKIDYTKNKYPSIAASTITLVGSGLSSSFTSATGAAPTKSMTAKTKSWTGKTSRTVQTYSATGSSSTVTKNINYSLPAYTNVNNASFGVKITYPKNTSSNEGWIQLKYIRITITYKLSSYSFKILSKSEVEVDKVVPVSINMNNPNITRYKPSVIISLPENCILQSSERSLTQNQDGTYTWNPDISNVYNDVLNLELVFTDDCETSLVVRETLNGAFSQFLYVVSPTPTGYTEEETFDSAEVIFAINNQSFDLEINVPESILENASNIKVYTDKDIAYSTNNGSSFSNVSASSSFSIPVSRFVDGVYSLKMRSRDNGITLLSLAADSDQPNSESYIIKVIPANLGYPNMSIIKLSDDELSNLADGVNYIVSSELKVIVDTGNSNLFVDYYRNFRLGVYNGPDFDENVETNVFDACKEWSSVMTLLNEVEERSVNFVYNSEYPVYIIITGDYSGANPLQFTMEYSSPLLYEVNELATTDCILPVVLKDVIAQENIANVSIPNFKSTNPFVVFDLPLDEDFETGDSMAVRGIELNAVVSASEQIGISATLKSPNGEIGSNSFIFNSENEETISMGGMFDLWGFSISDMVNLSDWEVEMQLSNNFNNPNGETEVAISDVSLTIHFMKVDQQVVQCFINGEDTRWYGMFLKLPEIPKGLKMDAKYITNEGTDVNVPIKQNIQTSEIKLTFGVHGCTIFETSQLLNEITKLIVNERNSLDRPIPNIIEFSHFPGEHWEYICNETFDTEVEAVDYETTVKLEVPAGTSYSNIDSITGSKGVVKGVAKVNPIITVTNITSDTVEIFESNTEQKFTLNYPFDVTKVNTVEINCIYRKVKLKIDDDDTEIDITAYVDFNSDWFILQGRFSFTPSNCVVQSVRFNERR